ncbi:MAG: hypothetical protein UIH27_15985 [Ruminococcus sp.]|nr:hypothetical protein [Ruminococcus sp.]
MYFTENKELQRFEREMKIVPNFERKEVWEYADSCNECKNYKCKLEGCMEAHCPYLMRKIRSNSIITRDLVETFLLDHPYIPFAHRVIDMLAKYKGNKLFYNKAHKAAFEAAMNEINDDDYDHIACVYALTIRPDIWEHCVHTSQGYLCMSAEIEQKDRVLISFANDIYRSTTRLSLKEISFRRNISDKEFYYICNAILIRRFGLAVIKKGV